jgi:hypothetical protein
MLRGDRAGRDRRGLGLGAQSGNRLPLGGAEP